MGINDMVMAYGMPMPEEIDPFPEPDENQKFKTFDCPGCASKDIVIDKLEQALKTIIEFKGVDAVDIARKALEDTE